MISQLAGGIEAGGTKFICIIGTGPEDIRARAVFPTTTPVETLRRCIGFLKEKQAETGSIDLMGIASFGPLDLDPASRTFGAITSAPKPGWGGAEVYDTISSALGVPTKIHTDVVGAALGEWRWGAGQGKRTVAYVTVGTGLGGGVVIDGRPAPALLHAEMGHMVPRRAEGDTQFEGSCPFHGDCLEGLASGTALTQRWQQSYETLPADHPAHAIEADYIAQLCLAITALISPHIIILGGGVMKAPPLIPLVRKKARPMMNGYFKHPVLEDSLDGYIVPPGLGDNAGPLGALALAYSGSAL